jgi:hypothetical protein
MKNIIQALWDGKETIETFRALHKAWDNDYSIRPVSLMLTFKMALRATDPIIETGSGLSTIVLGIAGHRIGQSVTTLEADEGHAKATQDMIDKLGIETVDLSVCGVTHELFYDPPGMPSRFGFWLHDGPMTFEGRMAGLDVMGARVATARIMIDDINVPGYLDAIVKHLGPTHRIKTVPDALGVALLVPRSTSDQG